MKKTIYYLLGAVALVAGLLAWQWHERDALQQRLEDLRRGNAKQAAALKAASAPKKVPDEQSDREEEIAAAVRAALAMPAGPERDTALNAAQLWNLKPNDALEVLPYFSGTRPREEALRDIFGNWAKTDPAAAVAASAKLPDKMDGYYAQKAIVLTWREAQPGAALAWVQTLPDGVFKAASIGGIATEWATNDLPGVRAWLQQAAPGTAWDTVFRAASAKWASEDPKAALDYVTRLPSNPLVNDTIASVVTAYAKTDAAGAAPYVTQIPDAKSQATAALAVGIAWAAKDQPAAQAWALSLPEGDTREYATAGVAKGWSTKDQLAALTWVQGMPVGDTRDRSLYTIMSFPFSLGYPQLTANIAATMQPGDAQQIAYKVVAGDWAETNPESAMQWVSGLPAGALRDTTTYALATGLYGNRALTAAQFAEAAPLITAIQSSKWRKDGIIQLAIGWFRVDYPAAAAWVNQTDLPEADKKALFEDNPEKK